jgi:hypothetical protein
VDLVGIVQLLGQRVEAVLAPRDEDQVVAAATQLVGDRAADSSGGAGDQRGAIGSVLGKNRGFGVELEHIGVASSPPNGGKSAVTVYLTPQCDVR